MRQHMGQAVCIGSGAINAGDIVALGARERAAEAWEQRVLRLAEPGASVGFIAVSAGCSVNQAAGALMRAGWVLFDGKCASFGLEK